MPVPRDVALAAVAAIENPDVPGEVWPYILSTNEPADVLNDWIRQMTAYCAARFADSGLIVREICTESMREYGVFLPLKKRPSWNRHYAQMKAGDHFVVPELSHFFDGPRGTETIIRSLIARGVHVHLLSADGAPLDSTTPEGMAFYRAIVAAVAMLRNSQKRYLRNPAVKRTHRKASFKPEVRLLMQQVVRWRNEGLTFEQMQTKLRETGGVVLHKNTLQQYDHIERALQSLRGIHRKLPKVDELIRIGIDLWRERDKGASDEAV